MSDREPIDPRVRRAVRGDRAAAQALLEELMPRVRNLVRYLVRGDQDVDDFAQQALVDILKGLPSYRGEAPLVRWADRVTARTALALAKRRRAEREREAELIENLYPFHPQTRSVGYLARRRLARALDALPDEQREAVVLHHVLELTVPEVAATLDVPFDTAKSRVRLAMKKLRAELEPERGGDHAPQRA